MESRSQSREGYRNSPIRKNMEKSKKKQNFDFFVFCLYLVPMMSETCFKVSRHAKSVLACLGILKHVSDIIGSKYYQKSKKKLKILVFEIFHHFPDRWIPVPLPPPLTTTPMIQADSVPVRESDRKSIVFPSSEGAEWATGARIHYFNVPGTRGEEIFTLRPLWRSIPAPFRFFFKLRKSRGLSSPTEHLSVGSESYPLPLFRRATETPTFPKFEKTEWRRNGSL